MRYPAKETAEKHQRILKEASRMFRERGFEGVNVAQIMQAAGLTHGTFYAHFDSKEVLAREAIKAQWKERSARSIKRYGAMNRRWPSWMDISPENIAMRRGTGARLPRSLLRSVVAQMV